MVENPRRKNLRLKHFDYSQAGYYFVTICTRDKQKLLSRVVKSSSFEIASTDLTLIGQEITRTIDFIENRNSNVLFNKYVIMPNHLHAIVILQETGGGGTPPLHKIIGQLKSFTNKRYNEIEGTNNLILWQRSFYDHIIRNEKEYLEIWGYIDTNPAKWEEDKYYIR